MKSSKTLPEGVEKLSGDEVIRLIVGGSVIFHKHNKSKKVNFYKRGKLLYIKNNGSKVKGAWYIDETDRFCYQIYEYGSDTMLCNYVYQFDDRYEQYTTRGIYENYFTISNTSTGVQRCSDHHEKDINPKRF